MFSAPEHRSFELGGGSRRALLLHGFMGTPAELRPLAERLAALGWRVSVPLLSGFGSQLSALPRRGWRDWLESARQAEAELRRGAEALVLIGFSMGGALALLLAAEAAPEALPDAAVLIAPFTRFAERRLEWVRFAKYVVPAYKPFERAPDTPEARALFERACAGANPDDPELRRRFAEGYAIPLGAVDALRRLGRRAYRRAPRLRASALVLQGEADVTALPSFARALAERLPQGRLELLPGGHDLILPGAAGHPELLRALEGYLVRLS